jgi:NADH-quinone oxidoreductase subunit B
MGEAVRRLYDQMAEPKWVIAMGACASSAGMFRTYSVMQGIDHIVPVDYYIPGCPPRPEMLLNALIELQKRVGEDRSFRRTQAGILMGSGSKG